MAEQTQIKTIGLFGGSFDPPHVAHVLMAAWALSSGGVDEVWVIPTGGHPFGKALAPFADRLEMCRRAFACYGGRARVLDLEREARVHYSVDTARRLAKEHPELQWRWIIGSDAYAQRVDWKEADELFRIAPALIVERQGHGVKENGARFALPDISSTMIRERLAEGDAGAAALEGIVPRAALDTIRRRGLYRTAS